MSANKLGFFFVFFIMTVNFSWASCTVSISQSVNFGNYNPFSLTEVDTTGTINLSCSGLVEADLYQISLNQGSYGSFSARQMANSANRLNYNLYTDTAHTTVWGDGTSGTSIQSGTCLVILNTCSASQTVYAKIPAQQNVAVGGYADSVTVTVNY